jgi:hypothetical protein
MLADGSPYSHLLEDNIFNLGFFYEEGDDGFKVKDSNNQMTNLGKLSHQRWKSGISALHFLFPSHHQASNTRTAEGPQNLCYPNGLVLVVPFQGSENTLKDMISNSLMHTLYSVAWLPFPCSLRQGIESEPVLDKKSLQAARCLNLLIFTQQFLEAKPSPVMIVRCALRS